MSEAGDGLEGRRSIQSIEVGGRLLKELVEARDALPLGELARRADMPAAKAHPYLVSFQKLGLVRQDPASGQYELGAFAVQMGLAALMQLDSMKLALPVADALAREAGHTVALAVAGSHGPTVVHIVESRIPIHLNLRKGSVMSLWGSATGRVFASWLPAEQVERLSRREQADPDVVGATMGPGTVAQRKALQTTVRREGLARIEGQLLPGVHALSAPVFDHTGALVLAITVLGPAAVFDASATGTLAQRLLQRAADLSRSLGWNQG